MAAKSQQSLPNQMVASRTSLKNPILVNQRSQRSLKNQRNLMEKKSHQFLVMMVSGRSAKNQQLLKMVRSSVKRTHVCSNVLRVSCSMAVEKQNAKRTMMKHSVSIKNLEHVMHAQKTVAANQQNQMMASPTSQINQKNRINQIPVSQKNQRNQKNRKSRRNQTSLIDHQFSAMKVNGPSVRNQLLLKMAGSNVRKINVY